MKAGELGFKAQQLEQRCVHMTAPSRDLDDLGLSLPAPTPGSLILIPVYGLWRIDTAYPPGLLKIHEKSSAPGKAPGTSMQVLDAGGGHRAQLELQHVYMGLRGDSSKLRVLKLSHQD